MSTTVSYKGNTIATIDNQTKKLTTAGTWLEDDITLIDVSTGGLDITDSTITADTILSGYVGYTANGTRVTGTASGGVVYQDENGALHFSQSGAVNVESNIIYQDSEGYIVVPGSSQEIKEDNDVLFIDYDGSVVASYSETEFASLTALPNNPYHVGLTSQGWNWTLSDAKSYVQNNHYLVIGQIYVPTDGHTHMFVTVGRDDYIRPLTVSFMLQRSTGTPTGIIRWGDGTTDDISLSSSGTNAKITYSHTYSAAGDYEIIIEISNDTTVKIESAYNDCMTKLHLGTKVIGTGISTDTGIKYCHYLKFVTFHNAFTTLGTYSFSHCKLLKTVILPGTVTSVPNYCFETCTGVIYFSTSKNLTSIGNGGLGCSSILAFALPEGFTSMPSFSGYGKLKRLALPTTLTSFNSIQNCQCLEKIDLHEGLTSIGTGGFRSLDVLYSVTLPSTLTSIGTNCFYELKNKAVRILHVKATTPPTLAASSSISGFASPCIIYVPYSEDHSVLQAYLDDTNWATKSALIQEEPQS